ncbi:MAG: hypothetical protein ACLGIS_10775, partial [Actinomycetes bacterium]
AAARRLPPIRAREIRGSLLVARRLAAAGRLSAERLTGVMAAVELRARVGGLPQFQQGLFLMGADPGRVPAVPAPPGGPEVQDV